MSTQAIYEAVGASAMRRAAFASTGTKGTYLDIGAGKGDLIRALEKAMTLSSRACDFHVELFGPGKNVCTQVDLNSGTLPYADAEFDLVTSSEVIEHLENFRGLLREAYRVTADDGVIVVTTPNVLNVKSRVRYLVSGFANLFGPLPTNNGERFSAGAHISPIPYFYLAHALIEAGFENVELGIDRVQKTSVLWLLLLAPIIFIGGARFMGLERGRFNTLTAENEVFVKAHFSWRLLVGRTIVVSAVKPKVVRKAQIAA
jgi:SAM-dependent methyltransferase